MPHMDCLFSRRTGLQEEDMRPTVGLDKKKVTCPMICTHVVGHSFFQANGIQQSEDFRSLVADMGDH